MVLGSLLAFAIIIDCCYSRTQPKPMLALSKGILPLFPTPVAAAASLVIVVAEPDVGLVSSFELPSLRDVFMADFWRSRLGRKCCLELSSNGNDGGNVERWGFTLFPLSGLYTLSAPIHER
ncbi:hypothetical protein BDZ97DRAFT_1834263, partial [Flammula alnicola]